VLPRIEGYVSLSLLGGVPLYGVIVLLIYILVDAFYGISICEGCFGDGEYTTPISSPVGPVITKN
jgi:hypothetical protein